MSPETIDAMLAAGVTAEVLAAAWKAEIAKQEESISLRRSRDAERQRRHRESRDVTVTGGESHDKGSLEVSPQTPLPKPSKISPLNPPKPKGEIPEWMPASFVEFRAMRKAMRNVPFGEGAERRVIAKITSARAEGHDPEKLLSKAIENGHRTVFPDENTRAAAGQVKPTSAEQISNLKRAIELYSRTGRRDLVSDARKRIEELEGGRPPPQVAQFARGLRA